MPALRYVAYKVNYNKVLRVRVSVPSMQWQCSIELHTGTYARALRHLAYLEWTYRSQSLYLKRKSKAGICTGHIANYASYT